MSGFDINDYLPTSTAAWPDISHHTHQFQNVVLMERVADGVESFREILLGKSVPEIYIDALDAVLLDIEKLRQPLLAAAFPE